MRGGYRARGSSRAERFARGTKGSRGGGSRIGSPTRSGDQSSPLWLLLGVVALIVLAVAFWLMKEFEEAPLDQALCPFGGPTAGTVIVLDLTDPVERSQLTAIEDRVYAEVDAAAAGTLFAVGLVRPEEDARGARFASCKPRSGADASELYENPRMIEERYATGFREPLSAAFTEMLSSGVADSSPIMESLQATLADANGFATADYPRRLIIVTDLLQHSPVFSFYRGGTWQTFSDSPDFNRLSRNLEGVEVDILRLPRPGARIADWGAVDDFWVNYFEQQGADRVRVQPIGDL